MSGKLGQLPSANWLALQKVGRLLPLPRRRQVSKISQETCPQSSHRQNKRKLGLGHGAMPDQHFNPGKSSSSSTVPAPPRKAPESTPVLPIGVISGGSVDTLRRMILGKLEDRYTDLQKQYVS